VRQLIKRILREETQKDLSPVIKELLNTSIGPKYKKIICTFDAIPPWKTLTNSEDYQIMVSVIGGPGSKRWPNTQDKVRERDAIVNDVWHTVYNFIGLSTDVFLRNVKSCDEVVSELGKQEEKEGAGAYDAPAFAMEPDHTTFKHEQKERETINRKNLDFFDLVNKGIVFVTEPFGDGKKQKSNWDGDSNIITLWNLKHPKQGQEWVFDAVKYPKPEAIQWWNDEGQFTLKDEKYHQILRSVELYNNSNKQEQNESELTERCWKGYTQKGMKTMFGKRYPNCVKKTK